MSHTVIGLFDTSGEAQTAAEALFNNGFSNGNVDVTKSSTSDSGTSTSSGDHSESSISKFFSSLFGSDDHDAKVYNDVANRSGSIVTVHAETPEEAQNAARILDTHGAIDVHAKAEQYGLTEKSGNSLATDSPDTIKIIEEKLQVGKKVVETGGARLRSRIVERPVEENIRLREEKVTVDRTAVGRPATEADFANFKEGVIELKEEAEIAVVGKEARVVEEVSLGKEVKEREETIRDTVRNTEVDVEKLDADTTKMSGIVDNKSGTALNDNKY